MPIIYIHGVANRDQAPFEHIEKYLRRFIAPEIASDPENVDIIYAFWGDVGARFRWDGASRPLSPLLGMGAIASDAEATQAITAASLPEVLEDIPSFPAVSSDTGSGLIAGGPSIPTIEPSGFRLHPLTPQQLSDLIVTTLQSNIEDNQRQVQASIAADAVAYDSETFSKLYTCDDLDKEWELLEKLITEKMNEDDSLVGMGSTTWLQNLRDRVKESLRRGTGLPGYAVSRITAEFRKPLNEFVTVFLGDVFTYLDDRGNATNPGDIPQRFLAALDKSKVSQQERPGEPLVVLSHSMGGQIVYDMVTHFLPKMPAYTDTKIDFWCATASQVGLFEELKLFIESNEAYASGNPVPFPAKQHLGYWWNVWDHTDFISYTANGIIQGLNDDSYDSGMSVIAAHGGYLKQPSFFRAFAKRVQHALSKA